MQPELPFIHRAHFEQATGLTSQDAGAWPAHHLVQLEVLWPLHVLSLRTLEPDAPDGVGMLRAAGVQELPPPGAFNGNAIRVVWSRPTEYLILAEDDASATLVMDALRPGTRALSCAVDRTAGVMGIELRGPGIERLLDRLVDTSATPRLPGQATRTRLVDIGVHLLRLDEGRLWVLADRAHADYLEAWLLDACQRMGD